MADKNDRDYDLDIKNHYRIEAGQNSPYGDVSCRILTNAGNCIACWNITFHFNFL